MATLRFFLGKADKKPSIKKINKQYEMIKNILMINN